LRISTYPFNNFLNAVTSMATDERPLSTRLVAAHVITSMVQEGDFKNHHTLAEFKKLREMLTKVQDFGSASVRATCAAMSDEEAREAAEQFITVLTRLVIDGDEGNVTLAG